MQLLRELLQRLITEDKLSDLQKKYSDIDVRKVAARDPSSTKKYLPWMLKQLANGASENDLFPSIAAFHREQKRFKEKDINKYHNLKALEDEVKSLSVSGRQARQNIKADAPVIYEDNVVVVVRPDSKKSCCIYGANTRWCITMEKQTYYEQYTDENVVFYFMLRKHPVNDSFDKVALAVIRDDENQPKTIQIYDAVDDEVSPMSIEASDNATSVDDSKIAGSFNAAYDLIKADAAKQPTATGALFRRGELHGEKLRNYINSRPTDDESYETMILSRTSVDVAREILDDVLIKEKFRVAAAESLVENDAERFLVKYFDDPSTKVRVIVAAHALDFLSSEELAVISNDKDTDVIQAIRDTLVNVAKAAVSSNDQSYKDQIDKKMALFFDVVNKKNYEGDKPEFDDENHPTVALPRIARYAILSMSPKMIKEKDLINDSDPRVRIIALRKLPEKALEHIDDEVPAVRIQAAYLVSFDDLHLMIADEDENVRAALVTRCATALKDTINHLQKDDPGKRPITILASTSFERGGRKSETLSLEDVRVCWHVLRKLKDDKSFVVKHEWSYNNVDHLRKWWNENVESG